MSMPQPPSGIDRRDLTSFDRAGTLVADFESALHTYGIRIADGSDLEYICLEILELENRRLGRTPIAAREDIRTNWRRSASLIEIVKLFLRAHGNGRGRPFVPHLDLLNRGFVAQNISIFPNKTDPRVFEASNKLFELFFALVADPLSAELVLDDPSGAKGDNPDILAVIDGLRWGFACKVISGDSPITMFGHLKKGIEQIQNSPADLGIVVFKLTNAVNHDAVWPILNEDEFCQGGEPIFAARPNLAPVFRHLTDVHAMKHHDLEHLNGRLAIEQEVRRQRVLPGALTYLQSTTSLVTDRGPLVTTVGQLGVMEFDPIPQAALSVFDRLNDVLHSRR